MSYELRLNGREIERFDDPQQAVARAREVLRADPDCQVEVMDTETGRPVEPAAARGWREDLAGKIGY